MASANSVAPGLTPAVSSDWLTQDTTAAQAGYGPAVVPGPDQDTVTAVPVGRSPVNPEMQPYAPASAGYQYDPEGDGPWPYVPEEWNANQVPVQRDEGFPGNARNEVETPHPPTKGAWNTYDGHYAGHDASYQMTDDKGWYQTTPTGRSATRSTFGQSNPENNPTWYDFGERPVEPHFAITATDFTTSDSGTSGGFTDGSLPDWSATGSQGNTVYETPGPAPVSYVPDNTGSLIESGWA